MNVPVLGGSSLKDFVHQLFARGITVLHHLDVPTDDFKNVYKAVAFVDDGQAKIVMLKDRQLFEMVTMDARTPFRELVDTMYEKWRAREMP